MWHPSKQSKSYIMTNRWRLASCFLVLGNGQKLQGVRQVDSRFCHKETRSSDLLRGSCPWPDSEATHQSDKTPWRSPPSYWVPGGYPSRCSVLDDFQYPPVEELPTPPDLPDSSPTPAQRDPLLAPQNSPESALTPTQGYSQRHRQPSNRFMVVTEHRTHYLLVGEEMWYLRVHFCLWPWMLCISDNSLSWRLCVS